MGFYDRYTPVKPATATVTAITGAAPQTGAGPTFVPETSRPTPGTLYAEVYAKATTSTLTLTGKWQISHDNSTWIDVVPQNNAANVVLVTGTGSAVTATRAFDAPSAVYGSKYIRFVVVSGVGVGAGLGQDEFSITYGWMKS